MFDKEKSKPVKLQLYVLPEDKAEIVAAATEAGLTMSEYIRQAIKFYYESTHSPKSSK